MLMEIAGAARGAGRGARRRRRRRVQAMAARDARARRARRCDAVARAAGGGRLDARRQPSWWRCATTGASSTRSRAARGGARRGSGPAAEMRGRDGSRGIVRDPEPGESRVKEACKGRAVGIDLGTTNSLVAAVAGGPAGLSRATTRTGDAILPSVVHYAERRQAWSSAPTRAIALAPQSRTTPSPR